MARNYFPGVLNLSLTLNCLVQEVNTFRNLQRPLEKGCVSFQSQRAENMALYLSTTLHPVPSAPTVRSSQGVPTVTAVTQSALCASFTIPSSHQKLWELKRGVGIKDRS